MLNPLGGKEAFQVSKKGLGKRAVRGVAISFGATVARFIIGLLSTAILARLLTPENFGTYEIVSSVAGLLIGIKSLGLAEATIQREQLSQEQVSNLFWINVFFGAILTGLMVILGPLLALIYREPTISWLNMAVGFTFVLSSLTVQHTALLTRSQSFGMTSVSDIISLIVGLVAAYIVAINGGGAWSLAAQALASTLIPIVIIWSLHPWRPYLRVSRGLGVRSMVTFGSLVAASRIIAVLTQRLDRLLLGLFVTSALLGQYGRAAYIAMLFQSFIIGPIEMPARSYLARVWNNNRSYAKRQFFRYFRLMILFPFYGGLVLSIIAPKLITILLGNQWKEASELASLMIVGGSFRIFHSTIFSAFIAFGAGRKLFNWSIYSLIVCIFLFITTAPLGAPTVAWAYFVSSVFIVVSGLYSVIKTFDAWNEMDRKKIYQVITSVVVSYITVVGLNSMLNLLKLPDLLSIFLILGSATIIAFGFMYFIARSTATDAWQLGKQLLSSKISH